MNMKKILFFAVTLATVFSFSACSGDTPSDVVEESYDCLKKGDLKGYFSNIYFWGKDAEDEKKNFEEFLERATKEGVFDKAKEEYESNDEIRNVKIKVLSEEIDEEGDKAVVRVNVKMGDVDKDRDIELRKDASGKWKLARGLSEM